MVYHNEFAVSITKMIQIFLPFLIGIGIIIGIIIHHRINWYYYNSPHPFDCIYLSVSLLCHIGSFTLSLSLSLFICHSDRFRVLLLSPPSTISFYPSLYRVVPDLFFSLFVWLQSFSCSSPFFSVRPYQSIHLFIVSYQIFSSLVIVSMIVITCRVCSTVSIRLFIVLYGIFPPLFTCRSCSYSSSSYSSDLLLSLSLFMCPFDPFSCWCSSRFHCIYRSVSLLYLIGELFLPLYLLFRYVSCSSSSY